MKGHTSYRMPTANMVAVILNDSEKIPRPDAYEICKGRHMQNFPGMQKVTLERMVQRAHEGMGHPDVHRFVRILRHSEAPEDVINMAKNLRRSVCEAYKLPAAVRQGAPPREELFINDLVGVDTVHLRDHQKKAVPDWHSHFQLVVPMEAENATAARKAYNGFASLALEGRSCWTWARSLRQSSKEGLSCERRRLGQCQRGVLKPAKYTAEPVREVLQPSC